MNRVWLWDDDGYKQICKPCDGRGKVPQRRNAAIKDPATGEWIGYEEWHYKTCKTCEGKGALK